MRIIKDTTGTYKEFPIAGTDTIVSFIGGYAEVDDKYIHHFEFYPGFEILSKGLDIPKPVDVEKEKSDNKDIKTEDLKKKS